MKYKITGLSKPRWIPKVRFINYRAKFPNMGNECFQKWFEVNRYWANKITVICIKHFAVELDFRGNFLSDMKNAKATKCPTP